MPAHTSSGAASTGAVIAAESRQITRHLASALGGHGGDRIGGSEALALQGLELEGAAAANDVAAAHMAADAMGLKQLGTMGKISGYRRGRPRSEPQQGDNGAEGPAKGASPGARPGRWRARQQGGSLRLQPILAGAA